MNEKRNNNGKYGKMEEVKRRKKRQMIENKWKANKTK